MSRRKQILDRVFALPALPEAMTRVMRLLDCPEVDAGEIARAIECDPGMTSNLLRLANSAYFGGPRQIGSVREAFVRLGSKRTFHLIVSSVFAPMARRPVAGYDLPAYALLRHSLATAIACEELAKALAMPVPDNVFTAGLLHDIGKIVLGTFVQADGAAIQQLAFQERTPFQEAESRVLGIDHAEVGAELLCAWNLPEGIVDAVRWHHDPDRSAAPSHMIDLVHAANLLTLMWGVGSGADGLNYLGSAEAARRLRLTPELSECALNKALDAFLGVESLFVASAGEA